VRAVGWYTYAASVRVERLDGVREKLIRADEHLQAIERVAAEYIVTEEFGIRTQWEHIPEKSGRSGTTWRADLKPPPPLRIAVLCGDFVHNLRSSLDHLARALVLESGGTPNDDPGDGPVTQFPVLEERLTRNGNVRPLRIIGGISPPAEFLLETVQPYQRVDDPTLHPLWILNRLWNVDKHRTLNVVGVNLGKITITFSDGRTGYARAAPFEDGALIYWVLDENVDVDHTATSTVEYAPSLAFREVAGGAGNEPVPVVELLRELRDYVRHEVVAPFARLCFGAELELPDPVIF
jgi:hypothetical protein